MYSIVHPALVDWVAMDGGHAVALRHAAKVRKYETRCNSQVMEFVPLAVDTFGGWHKVALQTLAKLGRQLARVVGTASYGQDIFVSCSFSQILGHL